MSLIDSKMAGQIELKLGGMDEGVSIKYVRAEGEGVVKEMTNFCV